MEASLAEQAGDAALDQAPRPTLANSQESTESKESQPEYATGRSAAQSPLGKLLQQSAYCQDLQQASYCEDSEDQLPGHGPNSSDEELVGLLSSKPARARLLEVLRGKQRTDSGISPPQSPSDPENKASAVKRVLNFAQALRKAPIADSAKAPVLSQTRVENQRPLGLSQQADSNPKAYYANPALPPAEPVRPVQDENRQPDGFMEPPLQGLEEPSLQELNEPSAFRERRRAWDRSQKRHQKRAGRAERQARKAFQSKNCEPLHRQAQPVAGGPPGIFASTQHWHVEAFTMRDPAREPKRSIFADEAVRSVIVTIHTPKLFAKEPTPLPFAMRNARFTPDELVVCRHNADRLLQAVAKPLGFDLIATATAAGCYEAAELRPTDRCPKPKLPPSQGSSFSDWAADSSPDSESSGSLSPAGVYQPMPGPRRERENEAQQRRIAQDALLLIQKVAELRVRNGASKDKHALDPIYAVPFARPMERPISPMASRYEGITPSDAIEHIWHVERCDLARRPGHKVCRCPNQYGLPDPDIQLRILAQLDPRLRPPLPAKLPGLSKDRKEAWTKFPAP